MAPSAFIYREPAKRGYCDLLHFCQGERQSSRLSTLFCSAPASATVNWLMIEIRNAADEVTYRNSFITDLPVERDTIVELAACGRARWKIENESFNTLKTKGYNLEHKFGHGKKHLSAVLATLNLLAFAFHTVAELSSEGRCVEPVIRRLDPVQRAIGPQMGAGEFRLPLGWVPVRTAGRSWRTNM
jgi:hypothetical protein